MISYRKRHFNLFLDYRKSYYLYYTQNTCKDSFNKICNFYDFTRQIFSINISFFQPYDKNYTTKYQYKKFILF